MYYRKSSTTSLKLRCPSTGLDNNNFFFTILFSYNYFKRYGFLEFGFNENNSKYCSNYAMFSILIIRFFNSKFIY